MVVRMRINPLSELMTNPDRIKTSEGDVKYPIDMPQRASNYWKQLINVESGPRAKLAVKSEQGRNIFGLSSDDRTQAPAH